MDFHPPIRRAAAPAISSGSYVRSSSFSERSNWVRRVDVGWDVGTHFQRGLVGCAGRYADEVAEQRGDGFPAGAATSWAADCSAMSGRLGGLVESQFNRGKSSLL
ncbi:hypothetical protein ACWD26_42185 [Streptomyces sp. NPDC002787]